jgi:hypothetical protein
VKIRVGFPHENAARMLYTCLITMTYIYASTSESKVEPKKDAGLCERKEKTTNDGY